MITRLMCWLYGHRWVTTSRYRPLVYTCRRCGAEEKEWEWE